jgi:hypothetical protein
VGGRWVTGSVSLKRINVTLMGCLSVLSLSLSLSLSSFSGEVQKGRLFPIGSSAKMSQLLSERRKERKRVDIKSNQDLNHSLPSYFKMQPLFPHVFCHLSQGPHQNQCHAIQTFSLLFFIKLGYLR